MIDDAVPDANELQRLENCRLGVSNFEDGLCFSLSWGPARIVVWLRDLLPKVFEHFSIQGPWIMTIEPDDDVELAEHTLPYVLLSRSQTTLTVAEVEQPDGSHTYRFRG